ncbi:MAG: AsmA-like C-terminal domain-containing protein, partial [Pseudomonadota bacterium]|nr:AsmA-like C-terminal domain-containing protein [Pseudomonadota bacterium]
LDVSINFPVEQALEAHQINFVASGNVANLNIPNLPLGINLSSGDMNIAINQTGIYILGECELNTQPFKVAWQQNFSSSFEFQNQYTLSGTLESSQVKKFLKADNLLTEENILRGKLGVEVRGNVKSDGKKQFVAHVNFRDAYISIPDIGWVKPRKTPAKLHLTATGHEKANFQTMGFDFLGKNISFSGHSILKNGYLEKIRFDQIIFGETKVLAEAIVLDQGWRVNIEGPNLDLTTLIDRYKNSERKFVRGPRFDITIAVERAKIFKDKFLRNLSGYFKNDGLVWSNVSFTSTLNQVDSLEVKLKPKEGKRYLEIRSNDAGAVLSTFGLYDNVKGGALELKAIFEDMTPDSKIKGNGSIRSFRLVDAPILARLLGLASITVIPDELAGAGLSFQRFDVPFNIHRGLIEFKDAKAGGNSLGITGAGILDIDADTLQAQGTIAPLDKINSLLGNLPLLGVFFSAGEKGGGIFAAEYQIMGPLEDPKITTNPLTVLAPGIFRKFFEMFPISNNTKGNLEWPDRDDPN